MKKIITLSASIILSFSTLAGYVECGCSKTHISTNGFYVASYVYSYSYLSDANGDCCSSSVYGLASKTLSRQTGGIDRTISETYTDIATAQAACC